MLSLRSRLYAAALLVLSGVAQALPQGGEVVAGDTSISVSGDTMNIHQNSQRTIINFQSFDVGSQGTVNFHQPSSDAVALNRVVGSNLSEIHGAINANGQVYLINPNGVLFGNGAQLDVGGLVVTTLDIADQDFLTGRDAFAGTAQGAIENRGTINAEGRVVLLAPEVINRGDIHAPGGDITLRASPKALLHTPGSEIPILVDSSEFLGQVTNEGNLNAGNVAMVLDGGVRRDVYDAAINNTGLVRAVGVSGSGGSIELYAAAGNVVNSGTLNASAVEGDGGRVNIHAQRVLQGGAITATGASVGSGGEIYATASELIVMHTGSELDASAGDQGDGGDVLVISDKATIFTDEASINARGGISSGDGGFVEVSGHEFVSVAGAVDVGANHGEGGLWYIDPTDITILPNFDTNGHFEGTNPASWTFSGTPTTSTINITSLLNTLNNTGNVLISTVSGGTGLGNITFDGALDYNNVGPNARLELRADNQIIFTANGRIFDSNTGSADGLNFTATAATGFSMAPESFINSGQGTIDITTAAGDAVITGLTSRQNISGTANAGTAVQSVRVAAPGGSILSANPDTLDIEVKDTGLTLSAMGEIGDLYIESDFIDVVSTTGNITLREFQSTSVYRMQTPGTAFITAGAQFAVELAAPFDVQNLQLTAGTDFRIDDAGFSIPGNLTVVANNLRGDAATVGAGSAGTPVILSANNADITLTNGTLERYWSTNFNQLALNISGGTGAFTLVDDNGLTLTSATTGGNASFTTNNADLILTDTPVVSGHLTLTTIGSGDLLLPDAGLIHGGNLTLLADNLMASDTSITLGATNADITLRDGAQPGTWNTSFDQLTLAISGTGDLDLTDTNGLTLNSVTTGGNASFATTDADLVLTETPVVAGDLSLSTVGSGNVIIPNATFAHGGGALVIHADDLLDVDRTLSLEATSADITLRNPGGNHSWATDFDSLNLAIAGVADVDITDNGGLTLGEVTLGGNASFTANGGDLVFTEAPDVAGNLNLTTVASGDLVVANAGLAPAGNLTVLADNLLGSGGPVTLGATNANITLRDGALPGTWTTSFDQLTLAITGAGDLNLTDTNGLTLNSVTTGGNASFATTDADLVLTETPVVAGDLSLSTIGSGNVIIPSGRFTHSGGGLIINADDLLDTDRTLSLEAASADITLRNPGGGHTWTTEFGVLDLAVQGAADISITDESGLSLGNITLAGNGSFATTGADLVFTEAPDVASDLNLSTVASGDLVVASAGLAPAGNLRVLADNLLGSGGPVTLGAANADITLRDGAQPGIWTTSFDQLVLNIAGAGAFALTNGGDLILPSITTGGNASFSATNGDLVLLSDPQVAGDLTLATLGSGDIIVPESGLHHNGLLAITADSLQGGGSGVALSAETLNATLRQQQLPSTWTTTLQNLDLSLSGGGALSLNNTGPLTVNRLISDSVTSVTSTGGLQVDSVTVTNDLTLISGGDLSLADASLGGEVDLTANGTLNIPNAGLSAQQRLTINAVDLQDGSGRNLTLSAPQLAVSLSGAQGNNEWTVTANELDLLMRGSANLAVTSTGGLTLTDLNNDGQAVLVENGNFALTLTNGDLTVAGNLSAADLTADGMRAGIIDLAVAAGDLRVEGPVTITSTNHVDQYAGADGHGIRLRLTDSGPEERTIALGGDTQLLAIGGDILIDTRPVGAAPSARRNFVQPLGSLVEAYNNPGDTQNGVVLVNNENTAASPGQVIRSGRTLAIVADVQSQGPGLGNVLGELGDVEKSIEVLEDVHESGPNASARFDEAFGSCDELDKRNPQRCNVDNALKAFLSRWLVGGELPPKTELR